MFGHTWASQQGDAPNDTWLRGLAGVRNDQYAKGLQRCLDRGDTFPPTLPEFRAMCLGTDGGFKYSGQTQCHKIYRPERRLEDLSAREAAQEAGARELANMKRLLGMDV